MASDILNWPRVTADQRLYVSRPAQKNWRGGLEDFYAQFRGDVTKDLWVFSGDDVGPGHLVLTIMQTNPMMIMGIDVMTDEPSDDGGYLWEERPRLHFRHGLVLKQVERRLDFGLADLTGYLEAADIRKTLRAMKVVHENDRGLFGTID